MIFRHQGIVKATVSYRLQDLKFKISNLVMINVVIMLLFLNVKAQIDNTFS